MTNLKYYLSCLRSYKFREKLVVIESDDWGGERIPNLTIRNKLKNIGIDYNKNLHLKFDTLECEEDFQLIFSLLSEINNKYNKKVKITANFNLVNPDYDKIESSKFERYFYKNFKEIYSAKYNRIDGWNELTSLIQHKYFKPQFHGREHLNYSLWLNELKSENLHYRKAFDLGCYAIDAPCRYTHLNNLMGSFEYFDEQHKVEFENSIIDGLSLFHEIFSFSSETIVPTRHVWHSESENLFLSHGVKTIQSSLIQLKPRMNHYSKVFHYTGELNKKSNIRYSVRNVFFEPCYNIKYDWVGNALNKIRVLFYFNIPVIISMHRINFVGGIDSRQRDFNLKLFKNFLEKLIVEYPDVVFITSDELSGKIVNCKFK